MDSRLAGKRPRVTSAWPRTTCSSTAPEQRLKATRKNTRGVTGSPAACHPPFSLRCHFTWGKTSSRVTHDTCTKPPKVGASLVQRKNVSRRRENELKTTPNVRKNVPSARLYSTGREWNAAAHTRRTKGMPVDRVRYAKTAFSANAFHRLNAFLQDGHNQSGKASISRQCCPVIVLLCIAFLLDVFDVHLPG